jgi:opacity protein-like surface antigen
LGLTLEYRYSDFGKGRFGSANTPGCCFEAFDLDAENHAVRVGLAFQFGGAAWASPAAPLK